MYMCESQFSAREAKILQTNTPLLEIDQLPLPFSHRQEKFLGSGL